jgi:hypothetical protein
MSIKGGHTVRNCFHAIGTLARKSPLASILLVTVACWLPYFSSTVVPFHDSAFIYQCFHYIYSEALFNHELARWIPNGCYGMPADLSQGALPPTAAVAGLAGLVFQLKNTLILGKIAMLLNEAIYAFGLYLLGRELYSRRLTQILITLAGVLSVSWLQQAFLNLSVFYLLPLVMYCLVRFFKTGSVAALHLAGLIEVCSVIGGVPYFAPLHALLLTIFSIPLALQHPRSLRSLFDLRHLRHPYLWIMIAVAAEIILFLAGGLENVTSLAPDRDPETGKVMLETFVNYGRLTIGTTIFGFVTGGIPHGDNTYYVGLLSLVLFGYALFTEKDSAFIGIAGSFAMLCWLSIGGVFAKAIYHFPGMNLFRHIGLVFGIASMLLLVGSGYGMDRFSRLLSGTQIPMDTRPARRCGWLGLIVALMFADLWLHWRSDDHHVLFLDPDWKPWFAFRVLVYPTAFLLLYALSQAGWSKLRLTAAPALMLGIPLLLDLGSFRAQVFSTMPTLKEAKSAEVFEADRIPYLAQRTWQPPSSLAKARFQVFTRPIRQANNTLYTILYSFVRMDPCRPNFRTDLLTPGICAMLEARGGRLASYPTDDFLPVHDQSFQQSLGCQADKIRLVRQAIATTDESEARRLFASLPDPHSKVVLLSDKPPIEANLDRESRSSSGTTQVEEFSSNRIKIRAVVEGAAPAWLVYADAWHPDWKARIDGRNEPIVRANLGFKAVRVEPGAAHVVEFEYQSRRTWLAWCHALIATASGFVLCYAMVVAIGRELNANVVDTPNNREAYAVATES